MTDSWIASKGEVARYRPAPPIPDVTADSGGRISRADADAIRHFDRWEATDRPGLNAYALTWHCTIAGHRVRWSREGYLRRFPQHVIYQAAGSPGQFLPLGSHLWSHDRIRHAIAAQLAEPPR